LNFDNTIKHANDETAVILQAESQKAIDNIEEIAHLFEILPYSQQ